MSMLGGQLTKKYDVLLEHLDYKYVNTCEDVKELEKILKVLRSGEEGKFPDLERHVESKIESIDPHSRALRKEIPATRTKYLGGEEKNEVLDDLAAWEASMQKAEGELESVKGWNIVPEEEEEGSDLPPVRSAGVTIRGNMTTRPPPKDSFGAVKEGKKALPRSYKDWEKVDVDAELEKVDKQEEEAEKKRQTGEGKIRRSAKPAGISEAVSTKGLSEEQVLLVATREKDKGNEAYRAGDFAEAALYYSRSISAFPAHVVYNNRALARIKLEHWQSAVEDCEVVLDKEPNNIKALLRHATALKGQGQLRRAAEDLRRVLDTEPENSKAKEMLSAVNGKLADKEKTGRKMVIEEVDGDSSSEDEHEEFESADEEVEVTSQVPSKAQDEVKQETEQKEEAKEAEKEKEDKEDEDSPNSSWEIVDLPAEAMASQKGEEGEATSEAQAPAPGKMEEDDRKEESKPKEPELKQEEVKESTEEEESSEEETKEGSGEEEEEEPVPDDPTPESVTTLKEEGNTLYKQGQYGRALEVYTRGIEAVERAPGTHAAVHATLLCNRAACHTHLGQLNDCITDCNMALMLKPGQIKPILRRADALEMKEKYGQAYVDYRAAVTLDSNARMAHLGSSRCQQHLMQLNGSRWRDRLPPPSLDTRPPKRARTLVTSSSTDALTLTLNQTTTSPLEQPEATPPPKTETPKPEPSAPKPEPVPQPQPTPKAKKSEEAAPSRPEEKKKSEKGAGSKAEVGGRKGSAQKPKPKTNKEKFEDAKATGNEFVKKGNWRAATACYTTCVALCPEEVAPYTNRALCRLKTGQLKEGEADCSAAINLDSKNVKALYRRALARKELKTYRLALEDMKRLLVIEPRNASAKKEQEAIKELWRVQLEALKAAQPTKKKAGDNKSSRGSFDQRQRQKAADASRAREEKQKKTAEASKPRGKKVMIEQVDSSSSSESEEEEEHVTATPAATSGRGADSSSTPVGSATSSQASSSRPNVPKLSGDCTSYEFLQAWRVASRYDVSAKADVLRQIRPPALPRLVGSNLDGDMLSKIVLAVNEIAGLDENKKQPAQLLFHLGRVQRVQVVAMFLSPKEKQALRVSVQALSDAKALTADQTTEIKQRFGM